MLYLAHTRVMIIYELPLAEIVLDFFDRLKSVSRGYASFDYEHLDFAAAPLVKLDILINGEVVDALSIIVHRDNAYVRGPRAGRQDAGAHPAPDVRGGDPGGDRQQDHRARDASRRMRKNVLAKCYGGDITRKRKLLEKQKEGKKRMKQRREGGDSAGGVSWRLLKVGR